MSPESEFGFLTQNELSAHINQVHYNITQFKYDKCAFQWAQNLNLVFFTQNELSAHINQVHYKITHSKCDECAFQKLTELVYTHMLSNPTQLTSWLWQF